MSLQVVTIVAGTETVLGEGVNSPVRCLVRLEDASVRSAIVKRLPPQCVAAEAFCALLLRGWGLSVPDCGLVVEPSGFASMDTSYPNMKQRIGWSDALPEPAKLALAQRGAELVSRFSETPLALAADEAIENRDRHLGNILWDGQNVSWIDHERALGVVPMADVNKLAQLAQMSTNMSNVQTAAVALALTLAPQAVADAEKAGAGVTGTEVFSARVQAKLKGLAQAVLSRFPHPPDLLAAP